jgi:plastocyanin
VASPAPGAGTGPQEFEIQVGDYYYQPSDLVVRAGDVRIVLSNVAGRRHTWHVQDRATGADLASADMRAREAATVTFTAPPEGTYRIYCNITDHAERGQVGTLTVART